MSTSNLCQQSQVHRLYSLYLHFDASHSAKHEDPECRAVLDQCFQLFEKDYIVGRVDNRNGQLCSTYPAELAILEGLKDDTVRDSRLLGSPETASPRDHLEHAQSNRSTRAVPAAKEGSNPDHPQQQWQNQQRMDVPIAIAPQAHVSQASPSLPPVDMPDTDQTLDLDESCMMSFQDIRAELDQVHQNSLESGLFMNQTNANSGLNDTQELLRLFEKSHFARVRARFVVPCILVRGKNICRSGTLSNEVEVFMHNVNQKFNDLNQKRKTFLYGAGEKSPDKEDREASLTKQRSEDIALLRRLGVTYINDLMVENRKVKYGLKVTSSEKVDSFGRYSNFKLVSTPYPGVEFFQKFKANKYSARKLCFDWSQTFADADLQLPSGHTDNLGIPWKDYKQWDLIELTQNYLRLYLTFIADGTYDPLSLQTSNNVTRCGNENNNYMDNVLSPKGLLIHCISGWDRTPLFISLLRISLWADGEIHTSLSAAELLYLTIGYDWFLFNHLLADRSSKGEDIFYFCFYFLKFIYSEEFSLQHITRIAQEKFKQDDGTNLSSPSDASVEDVCESCRCLSPTERLRLYGGSGSCGDIGGSASKNDVASSVDGKPSSWQFVSFAAGPTAPSSSAGREDQLRYGSSASTSISNSTSAQFIPSVSRGSSSLSSRQQGGCLPPLPFASTPSPSKSGLKAALQGLGTRNKCSSPSSKLSSSSSQHAVMSSKLGGCEMTRTATSPDLGSGITTTSEDPCNIAKDCSERNTRKRASTFDGGLLISSDASAIHPHDGHESDDEEDDEDDMEDLTSGDDAELDADRENLFVPSNPTDVPRRPSISEQSSSPHRRQYQECRYCRQRFTVSRPRHDADSKRLRNGPQRTASSAVGKEALRYGRSDRVGDGAFSDREKRISRSRIQYPVDSDREEVFQLEIEDSKTTNHRPLSLAQQRRLGSILSPVMDRKRRSFLNLFQTDDVANEIENDEDSVESNTCRDREGVKGVGGRIFTSDSEWDQPTSQNNPRDSRRMSTSFFGKSCGGSRSDVEDDDDDDGEGMAGSLGSVRGCLKLEQHQNDRMFMPSLQGMFSPSIVSDGFGEPPSESGRTHLMRHDPDRNGSDGNYHGLQPQDCQREEQHHKRTSQSSPMTESFSLSGEMPQRNESSKRATRRQRLREIRRLFMEMRHEIGDGSRPPSRGGRHLLVAAAATASSAVVGATGVGSGGHLDDSSDQLSPSGMTDDSSASSFPFGFDLSRHHQHHRHQPSREQHQYHAQGRVHQESPGANQTSSSSSTHHYVASFFGTNSSPSTSRDSTSGIGAEKESDFYSPSAASDRRHSYEWAATRTPYDGRIQPRDQQPSRLDSSNHRPSIPEVPSHLMMDNSPTDQQKTSPRRRSAPRVAPNSADLDDDHFSCNSPYQHSHRYEDEEETDIDPEPFHDEDSIDYSASFLDSCDIPSSASFLQSERLFTSTLAAVLHRS
ncbi:Myotubularin- protein 14 [Actinomortierella wolfii]|nr:Myotubularin- protein 14 [Actinomortierella wolfii]